MKKNETYTKMIDKIIEELTNKWINEQIQKRYKNMEVDIGKMLNNMLEKMRKNYTGRNKKIEYT